MPANSVLVCAVNSTRGKQNLGDVRSNRLSAYLSGAGFASRNSADVSRKIGSAHRLARNICSPLRPVAYRPRFRSFRFAWCRAMKARVLASNSSSRTLASARACRSSERVRAVSLGGPGSRAITVSMRTRRRASLYSPMALRKFREAASSACFARSPAP
jgi:hypothetical protein